LRKGWQPSRFLRLHLKATTSRIAAVAVRNTALADELHSEEFRALQARFSSGLRLGELRSLAVILSSLAGIMPPGRGTQRQYIQLVRYIRKYWARIAPVLPLVQLKDENNILIDGRREMVERSMKKWISGE
jgi:hypothetical protein